MTVEQYVELEAFASLSREDAEAWLAARQAENEARRKAECEANGAHVLAMDETACPHCGTPYSEVFDG
jgi:hypothetical protein